MPRGKKPPAEYIIYNRRNKVSSENIYVYVQSWVYFMRNLFSPPPLASPLHLCETIGSTEYHSSFFPSFHSFFFSLQQRRDKTTIVVVYTKPPQHIENDYCKHFQKSVRISSLFSPLLHLCIHFFLFLHSPFFLAAALFRPTCRPRYAKLAAALSRGKLIPKSSSRIYRRRNNFPSSAKRFAALPRHVSSMELIFSLPQLVRDSR